MDLEAAAKDFDGAPQRGGVGAVAAQDGEVEGRAMGVGCNGQDDLRAVGAVVAAVSVAREGCGTRSFEIDAGEVVEGEADRGFEGLIGEFFSKAHQWPVRESMAA